MDFKNNVTRFLESKKVNYQVFTYDYDAGIRSAVEVAAAIGLPPEQVFKTLVTLPDDAKRKPMLVSDHNWLWSSLPNRSNPVPSSGKSTHVSSNTKSNTKLILNSV